MNNKNNINNSDGLGSFQTQTERKEEAAKEVLFTYEDRIMDNLEEGNRDLNQAVQLYGEAQSFANHYFGDQTSHFLDFVGVQLGKEFVQYDIEKTYENVKDGDLEQARYHLEQSVSISEMLTNNEKGLREMDSDDLIRYQAYSDIVSENVGMAENLLEQDNDDLASGYVAKGIYEAESIGVTNIF